MTLTQNNFNNDFCVYQTLNYIEDATEENMYLLHLQNTLSPMSIFRALVFLAGDDTKTWFPNPTSLHRVYTPAFVSPTPWLMVKIKIILFSSPPQKKN